MGSIIIQENENWYYCPLQIENTNSLSGWTALDFSSINVEPR